MKNYTITIDREYGSGGREVAKSLSQKLGVKFYDGELLLMAGEQHGMDIGLLKDYDEKRVGSPLYDIAMSAGNISYYDKQMVPYQIYESQSKIMKELAQEEPCIILGRCAGHVLKEVVPVLNIFIYASDMQDKVKRVQEVDQVSARDVEAFIKKKDQQRSKYHKFYTREEWGAMKNYAMCLNTSLLGYEGAAEAILGKLGNA